MILQKLDICVQKNETRSLSLTSYKIQIKIEKGLKCDILN
jgi:hypothetical protein